MMDKVKILDRRFIPAGQMVIEQGCIGNRAFIIESGKVEVFMKDKKGRVIKIADVGPGGIIGEMALIDGSTRSASIRTTEDSILVAISQKDIEESIGQKNGLFQKMMKIMVDRIKDTNIQLMRHKAEMAEIEEAAQMTVNNIALHVPEGKQKQFRHEVVPLLDKLKHTLAKYNHLP